MAKKIVWTHRAKFDLFQILDYWTHRNQSSVFSLKLNNMIVQQLELVLKFPDIGRKTDIENVFVKVIQQYLVFYEFIDNDLFVLHIRHGKRNNKTLKIK